MEEILGCMNETLQIMGNLPYQLVSLPDFFHQQYFLGCRTIRVGITVFPQRWAFPWQSQPPPRQTQGGAGLRLWRRWCQRGSWKTVTFL